MRGDCTEIVITRLFKGRTSSMIMKPIAAIPPKILVDYFTVKKDGKSARTLTHVPASHSAAEPLKAIFELFIRKLQTTPSIVERIVQYTLKNPRISPEMVMIFHAQMMNTQMKMYHLQQVVDLTKIVLQQLRQLYLNHL